MTVITATSKVLRRRRESCDRKMVTSDGFAAWMAVSIGFAYNEAIPKNRVDEP